MRMTRHAARLFGLGLWLITSAAACGSSSDAGSPDAGGDGSPDGSGGAFALTCTAYCQAIQVACTMGNQQYGNEETCEAACAAFARGASGETAGDTLGCRLHYTALAMSAPSTNCRKAGPGGDGVCGENCGGYCDLAMTFCTASNQAKVYDSRDACLADCATHGADAPYTSGDPGRTDMGNQVACQLYHAVQASLAPVGHCLGDLAAMALTCRE